MFFINTFSAPSHEATQSVARSPMANGRLIRQLRERLGLSRLDLAARASGAFDERWLETVEDGARVDATQLHALARHLGCEPPDIIVSDDIRSPFRGLLSFEPEDAPLFGGRDRGADEITALLRQHAIVALIGASGSGKSSVVKAGVVPRLRNCVDAVWRGLTIRPGNDPLLALARAIGSELDRDRDEDQRIVKARARAEVLFEGTARLSQFLERIAELRAEPGAAPPSFLLFVDQWEELYTQAVDPNRRRVFLDQLMEGFGASSHRLILTMRADFMGDLLEVHRPFFDVIKPGICHLPKMSRSELAEAIEKPAAAVGLSYEDGLTKALLDDAGDEPGNLALVEFTLTELWKRRDKQANRLTLASYHEIDGLQGAIDRHADAVYTRLPAAQQIAARRALTRLVHVSTLESFVRARRPLSAFSEEGRSIIRALAAQDNRLVVISYDDEIGEDVAEVAHEALIREWKKLQEWVSGDPGFLQWRDDVERRQIRYEKKGRNAADLLFGAELDDAESWLRTRGSSAGSRGATNSIEQVGIEATEGEIPAAVRAYIAESLAQRACELQEKQKIQAERDAFRRKSSFVAVFAAIILAFLVVGLSFALQRAADSASTAKAAQSQSKIKEFEAHQATTRALISEARAKASETRALGALAQVALNAHRPADAIQLALAAWPRDVSDERPQIQPVLDAISGALAAERLPIKFFRHEGPVTGALFLEGGQKILSWSDDDTLRLWNSQTGNEIVPPMRHGKSVTGALVSEDETRMLSWSLDDTLRWWDLSTGKELVSPMRLEDNAQGALLLDGAKRALSWSDRSIRVWDLATGSELGAPMGGEGRIEGVTVSKDGRRAVSWSADETVRFWNTETGQKFTDPVRIPYSVNGIRFSSDETRLLLWGIDGLRLLDASTGKEVVPPMAQEFNIQGAWFSRGENQIIAWSESDGIRRWDVHTGEELYRPMRNSFLINGMTMSGDNGDIFSWSDNSDIILWDPVNIGDVHTTMRHDGPVLNAILLKDERRILSWSEDKTLRLWETRTGRQLLPSMRHDGNVVGAILTADETRLLSWSDDNTLRLWDVTVGAQTSRLRHKRAVTGALLISDTGPVVSWSRDGFLRVRDLTTGSDLVRPMEHNGPILGAAMSKDKDRIVSWTETSLELWDRETGASLVSLFDLKEMKGAFLTADSRRILFWSGDNRLRMVDSSTGMDDLPPMVHGDGVSGALLTRNEKRILSWSKDGSIRLWDAMTGQPVVKPMQHSDGILGGVSGVLLSQDEKMIVSWSEDFTLRIWDAETGLEVVGPMRHGDPVNGALLFANGSRILSWSGKALHIWDAMNGNHLMALRGHTSDVAGATLSTDGTRLVSWAKGKDLRVWDVRTGAEIAPPMWHDGWVTGALLIDGGARIVSWSRDDTIRLWDAKSGMLLLGPMYHSTDVVGLLVLSDEKRVLSWSTDTTLRSWNIELPEGNLLELACARLPSLDLRALKKSYGVLVDEPICTTSQLSVEVDPRKIAENN